MEPSATSGAIAERKPSKLQRRKLRSKQQSESVEKRDAPVATLVRPALAAWTISCVRGMEQSEKTSSSRAMDISEANAQKDTEIVDAPQSRSKSTNNNHEQLLGPAQSIHAQLQSSGATHYQGIQAKVTHPPLINSLLTPMLQDPGIGLGLTVSPAVPTSVVLAIAPDTVMEDPHRATTLPTPTDALDAHATEPPPTTALSAPMSRPVAKASTLHQLATPPPTLSSKHIHTPPSNQLATAAGPATNLTTRPPFTAPTTYHSAVQVTTVVSSMSSAGPLSAPIAHPQPQEAVATALRWPMSASTSITGLPPPRNAGGRPMLSPAMFPLDTVMAEQQQTAAELRARALSQNKPIQVAASSTVANQAGVAANRAEGFKGNALQSTSEAKPKLGNLHKRRMISSPEKFNTGQFEPLPIKTSKIAVPQGTPTKRNKPTTTKTEKVVELLSNSPATSSGEKAKDDRFSVLTALFKQQEILIHMVSFLNVPSLIALYSISKTFHYLFNSHPTAFIMSIGRVVAPMAERIFPWCNYKSLCMNDPSLKRKNKYAGIPNVPDHHLIRDAPSLRWLQMVVWREGVSRDIVIQLWLQGLRVPFETVDALKRMWFLMDLPLNSHRIALLRNRNYFTAGHIYLLTQFFLKLDMAFTSPTAPLYPRNHANQFLYPNYLADCTFIGVDLRETLLAERNLTSLWRILHGWSPETTVIQTRFSKQDIIRLHIRHHFKWPAGLAADDPVRSMPLAGIPAHKIGMAGMERIGQTPGHTASQHLNAPIVPNPPSSATNTGTPPPGRLYPHAVPVHINLPTAKPAPIPLLRPDELMMREAVRRCLNLPRCWGRMMAWGFVDKFGRKMPVYTERELGRLLAGLPAGRGGAGRSLEENMKEFVELADGEVELVDQYGEAIMSVAEMLGKEE